MASRLMIMSNAKASLQQLVIRRPIAIGAVVDQRLRHSRPSILQRRNGGRSELDDRVLQSLWGTALKSSADHSQALLVEDALRLRVADMVRAAPRGRPAKPSSDEDDEEEMDSDFDDLDDEFDDDEDDDDDDDDDDEGYDDEK